MGFIQDGSISGRLPTSEAFVIHYPAYPSSISRAVNTLGGVDAIANMRNSKSNELELRFRPEDLHSHPTFGRLYPCNNLLLRICKKTCRNDHLVDKSNHYEDRISKSGDPSSVHEFTSPEAKNHASDDLQICLTADVVARVRESYEFKGMVDYQHILPSQGDIIHRKKRRRTNADGPKETEDLARVDKEDIMALLPLLFSPKDLPQTVALRPSALLSFKKKQEAVVTHRWEMEIESSIAIGFDIKEIPKKVNWEQYLPENSEQWKWQMEVSKLFEERPIWPRASIHERLGDMGHKFSVVGLKRLLFRSAYYFGNGPFQRFWIRKGYDPRKDPESRIYQRIEFRVPKPLVKHGSTMNGVKHRWDDICAFRVLPTKRQLHLQLFEISDDFIQQEIRKPPTETVCYPSTGWFSSYFLDCMRSRIAIRFLSICNGPEAESLLKSVNVKFKRTARTRFQPNTFRVVGKVQSEVNQEPVTGIDKGGASDDLDEDANEEEEEEEDEEDDKEGEDEEEEEDEVVEDVDEEDEDEDYDEEEEGAGGEFEEKEDNIEVDASEEINGHHSSHLAAKEDDQLLSGSNKNAGNFSQSYLQDLLGSFPATESGGLQGEDANEEFEIYEQDSDSSDSDDD